MKETNLSPHENIIQGDWSIGAWGKVSEDSGWGVRRGHWAGLTGH